ncbi:SOS response-associated peptidase family protein [Sphingomonas sp. 28-63-12]|uniref:SOS response-associated peptidase family protein n=1 Tax=Sphingomonas sp. 28-63-12 TaxID=1970434 RepID=UPI000BC8294E|nr:MAG: DUF159 family protein [Sphingomonas sp. 28-63-12]
MCNEAARRISLGQLREDWSQIKIPLVFPEGAPNMAPLESIRITDPTVIIRAAAGDAASTVPNTALTAELVTRRWSWPLTSGPGAGKPLYNLRSEGRRFGNSAAGGRCLIPVDGFYEFTAPEPGQKRKTKWIFTPAPGGALAGAYLCIAGIWRTHETVGEAFTMLTTTPGPDVAPYHSRQVVLLPRAHWGHWIAGQLPAADLIAPAPAGSLAVARV